MCGSTEICIDNVFDADVRIGNFEVRNWRMALSRHSRRDHVRHRCYGLLAAMILLAPIIPAVSIVSEKQRRTLEMLLISPMSPWSIYFGKLVSVLAFVLLLLATSVPAVVACYAMGGISFQSDVIPLYGLLFVVALQMTMLGLVVSGYAASVDSALRLAFGGVLSLAVVPLAPYLFLQGTAGNWAYFASRLRHISPIPAVMHLVGHQDIGSRGTIEDLAANKQDWTVIVNHFPVYCDGNYNSDDNSPLVTLRELLVPIAEEHGVDLFVAGHDHTYQRTYLIDGHYGSSTTFDPNKHIAVKGDGRSEPLVKKRGPHGGTMYIVSGTGGGMRPQGKFVHPAMVPIANDGGQKNGIAIPGSLVLEIEGAELRGWQIGIQGQVFDHFSIRK